MAPNRHRPVGYGQRHEGAGGAAVSKCPQLDYSSPTRGIGSGRTRTRAGSKVTMQPFSRESTSWGRLASSVRASTSGFRLPSPRNWMTDGCRDERAASSVPNQHPPSREFDPRRQRDRRSHRPRRAAILLSEVDRIVTGLLQERSERWRQSVVDQELHSPAARGRARSRTASAAKSSASRTSSASRSGYSARMASVLCPSATRATTVAAGIRRPRRHGTPPIWRGLAVILLNSMLTV
jgi:hypothetical protein